ncbi:virulence RhuM family protein [Campylobacter sputorum]|uniref:virulence RhuM family protein n=1 Tax=Campylobacter sputorum TaxID=206 RepID=UPI000B781387|nr:virulence RhuM family protein [Campylobacter sputorum]ASM37023.1 putative virulence protein, RhuM family [Campylobacter sputorum bv. faecalis CCUG 20703]
MSEILIYHANNGKVKINVILENETIWLSQKQLCELYGKSKSTISEHIKAILDDEELDRSATVRNFRTVQKEGERDIERDIEHYNLDMIIALGFKVRSRIGVQFRKWANTTLKEYIIKGFVIDDERLKNPVVGTSGGNDYFDEMLERIRDIRASEKRVYLRVREIFKLSSDYDPSWSETTKFFAHIQNKLHYAIAHQTAAEIIGTRANAKSPNMSITALKADEIKSTDVTIAKNYLSKKEIDELNRIVVMWLDYAEDQANRRKQVFLKDWEERLDKFLEFNEREMLKGHGKISKKQAYKIAKDEFEKFRATRRAELEKQGENDIKELENLTKQSVIKS